MDSVFTHDVFLSHSSKDKKIVRRLAERLRGDGLKIWFDEWEIRPGDSIPRKIDEGLETSAVLVLCMSASSLGSDWVALESQAYRFTDPVNRNLRFIPLRLDETELRPSLRLFAYVDWRDEGNSEAYSRLLSACKRRNLVTRQDDGVNEPTSLSKEAAGQRLHPGSIGYVDSVTISANGKRVVSGSRDNAIRIWDLEGSGNPRLLRGHKGWVFAIAITGDGMRMVSGGGDSKICVWDLEKSSEPHFLTGHTGSVTAVAITFSGARVVVGTDDGSVWLWDLDGSSQCRVIKDRGAPINAVAISAEGKYVVSGANDNNVCVWDQDFGEKPKVLKGHAAAVTSVSISSDGQFAVSGSQDNTVRIWNLKSRMPPRVLEGHTDSVTSVAISGDNGRIISGSSDMTVRAWDPNGSEAPIVLTGHGGKVTSVAISANGERVVSGSADNSVKIWRLNAYISQGVSEERTRYTNAKVVVVGDTGSGKTGITVRLAHDLPPSRWPSTSGVWSTQWLLKDLPTETGWEQELWLWDFGGQADQRLVHQLYLDRTAAVLLLFDADKETVLPGLREWQQALSRSVPPHVPVLLLAGRTDVGSRFDRLRVHEFAHSNGYQFFETSSETNRGIFEIRKALLSAIPWQALEQHDSPVRFKRLKDEILSLRDEGGVVLVTFKELESLLRSRLDVGFRFSGAELKAVVSLLDGPGVVKEIDFGSYILLRPEWINIYAQAVIRTLRAAEYGLGYMPVRAIRAGELIFQPSLSNGQVGEERRLQPNDEQIVLQSMESALLGRRLCLQQDGDLVFPSYCGRERPPGPVPLTYFVTYSIDGFLDDIYATLVVKLAHCGAFKLKDLWHGAADFATLAGNKVVGVRLQTREEGGGEVLAHHADGVTSEERVIFASYIHQHLVEQSTTKVQRLRHYLCPHPHCGEPVENRRLAMERLLTRGEKAEILCPKCEQYIPLWDKMEELFADEAIRLQVLALRSRESFDLDARRLDRLLASEVSARLLSANQRCIEIPRDQTDSVDLEVEFTTAEGRRTANRMFLLLKSGNSHLKREKDDNNKEHEIFSIQDEAWVNTWAKTSANGPLMLVIGTVFATEGLRARSDDQVFQEVRWMEIGTILRTQGADATKPLRKITFRGDRLDNNSILRWRDKVMVK